MRDDEPPLTVAEAVCRWHYYVEGIRNVRSSQIIGVALCAVLRLLIPAVSVNASKHRQVQVDRNVLLSGGRDCGPTEDVDAEPRRCIARSCLTRCFQGLSG
jgi:hypothetical protein